MAKSFALCVFAALGLLAGCRIQEGRGLPEQGRTPALVTLPDGSLYAVCERLGDDGAPVGLATSVSQDGGRHWRTDAPASLNGLSYPCLLDDESAGEILLLALEGPRPAEEDIWNPAGIDQNFQPGMLLLRSRDGGVTWAEKGAPGLQVGEEAAATLPENVRLSPAPGRGIKMTDGTLVFPVQRIDLDDDLKALTTYNRNNGVQTASSAAKAGVMVSEDGGITWQIRGWAKDGTTESQVAETAPGTLMLSLRDNARTGRAIYTSTDKGCTWERFEADGMLSDPVCEGSLLQIPAAQNIFGNDLMLFCNPDEPVERGQLTLRLSTDAGFSYPFETVIQVKPSHGYCCLTRVNGETVGVLYESPDEAIRFKSVKLKDLYPAPVFKHLTIPVVTDKDVPVAEFLCAPWDTLPALHIKAEGLPEGALQDWHIDRGRVWVRIDGAQVPETSPAFTIKAEGKGLAVRGNPVHRIARKVRDRGDDGVFLYRIPGLVRTHAGTLVACYGARWKKGKDVPNDVSVCVSRSSDGGRTWGPMQVVMDMGEWGGASRENNGVDDPCLLLDETTGELMIFAGWRHVGEPAPQDTIPGGYNPTALSQMLLTRSVDDGQTWSAPVNLSLQLKDPTWISMIPGPGIGITLEDGTLAVPIQFEEADGIPSASIITSRDHGATWQRGQGRIKRRVNEAQIAENEPGTIMINARDRSISGRRAVYTTTDLGDHWTKHATDSTLAECFCQASLYKIKAADNCLGRDLLLFCNCNHNPRQRRDMTVRLSLDGGLTWPCALLLDHYHGMGYSCMTLLDPETLGIFYESSQGCEIFQTVPLRELYETQNTK